MKSFAQNAPITEAQMLYMNDYQFGVNANTHGLGGASFRYGWHKTGLKIELWKLNWPLSSTQKK
jgi:hypothetical protein